MVPDSIMPAYPWLGETPADDGTIQRRMRALRSLGHPYTDADIEGAPEALVGQMEVDAVVAYLQVLRAPETSGATP